MSTVLTHNEQENHESHKYHRNEQGSLRLNRFPSGVTPGDDTNLLWVQDDGTLNFEGSSISGGGALVAEEQSVTLTYDSTTGPGSPSIVITPMNLSATLYKIGKQVTLHINYRNFTFTDRVDSVTWTGIPVSFRPASGLIKFHSPRSANPTSGESRIGKLTINTSGELTLYPLFETDATQTIWDTGPGTAGINDIDVSYLTA